MIGIWGQTQRDSRASLSAIIGVQHDSSIGLLDQGGHNDNIMDQLRHAEDELRVVFRCGAQQHGASVNLLYTEAVPY